MFKKKHARPGTRLDSKGNEVADVRGGPCDGDWFYSANFKDGDTFVPIRAKGMWINRPVYGFVGGRLLFTGYLQED